MKILLNVLLALFFGILSGGAFLDGRKQAIPLAVIFAVFTIYSAAKAIARVRKSSEP